jgi:ABC-type transport system involved in multi-copper enzyme maturation permease subunit
MAIMTADADSPFAASPTGFWVRVDRQLERAGERLNPILVKESRQALKSRQFLITFILLLVCGWCWSLIGVAVAGPSVYYSPSGLFMLAGFHFVLSVPLLLIVPFAAYRSLAGEREDGTYELLSITTLSSRQIVTGKLGSAVLQMLIYYSALAPCIAFTYLLRGVDVLTIGLVLFYSFLASVLLSVFGLAVAASTRNRVIQLLLSVAFLIGLVFLTIVWCIWWVEIAYSYGRLPFDSPDFWIGQLAFVSGYLTYFCLFLFAAAAQLSFASDNRSTKLRIMMLVQQVLFTGWIMYYLGREHEPALLYVWLVFSGLHWFVMGALMTGELAPLSPRVKRQLPQSFLGRVFLTWFNPGSGTGYVFAVTNLAAVVLLAATAATVIQDARFGRFPRTPLDVIIFGGLVWGYVAAYLGVGRLLVLALRQVLYFGLLLPFLVHIVLALAGAAFPTLLHAWSRGLNSFNDYTPLQVTNWVWTLAYAGDGKLLGTPIVPLLVTVFATGVLVINLVLARREVEQTRQEVPQRVRQDEQELHPERAVLEKKPSSPFDDD